jgi:predicted TPR repeat methyltransferase
MAQRASEWRREGDAHYDAQRWDDAVDAFERALALDPGFVEAWFRLGNARQDLGNNLRATECFERAVALEPTHAKAWNNLGVSRQKLGQDRPAAEAYRHAVNLDPAFLQAILNLAHVTASLGDDEGAMMLFERATSLDPDNTDTWQTLALAQLRLGREAEANTSYLTAMQKLAPVVQPMLDEAESARVRGDHAAAEELMVAALKYMPHNPLLKHMIAAMRGETSLRASKGYVAALFDDFAQNYDQRMRVNLQYRVPEHLASAVIPLLKPAARVIDLGCGTGFLGTALENTGASITGIDLSEKMLEQAAKRGGYARLVKADLIEELERTPPRSVDAVLAADVFVYLGDLQPVFAAVARVLASGGSIFAFTAETLDQGSFQLRTSGRYAHSLAYIRDLAKQSHLIEHSIERIQARREGDHHIEAWLACFLVP